jgi:hypothetical protein
MREKFDAQLYAAFRAADDDRNKIEAFKRQARQDPVGAAKRVSAGISLLMERDRMRASELYGVDIADSEGLKEAELLGLREAVILLMLANSYLTLGEYRKKLDSYAADPSLSEQEFVEKTCQVGIEVLQSSEAILLHTLRELRLFSSSKGSEKAASLAKDSEAQRLAGHLVTRISFRNQRLAKAIDDVREHEKPATRERFEALLRELYVLSPEVWDEYCCTDWRLMDTRSAVVRRIEAREDAVSKKGREDSVPKELKIAAFAHREGLLQRGKNAGLPPREYELFTLVVENSGRFLRDDGKLNHREAAQELGVAIGTVKSLWSRTRKTLAL